MVEVDVASAALAERCAAIQRGLREERPGRRELSGLEHGLEAVLDDLKPAWAAVEAALGVTPEVRLARAALQALEDSVAWARAFRKHAPLRERREHIVRGLQGAAGASRLLERVLLLRSGL